jgi:hypothetical protein
MGKRTADEIAEATMLSDQQAEILLLKQSGLTHQEIADELGIERGSVDAQSSRINAKHDRAQRTVEEVTGPQLHGRDTLPDGTPLGKIGGLWQLLDETDTPVGEGFHEIVLGANGYYGKRGAVWYSIDRYGDVQEEGVEPPDDVMTDGGLSLELVKRQYVTGESGREKLDERLDHILAERQPS